MLVLFLHCKVTTFLFSICIKVLFFILYMRARYYIRYTEKNMCDFQKKEAKILWGSKIRRTFATANEERTTSLRWSGLNALN
jgi:hypothetical protein